MLLAASKTRSKGSNRYSEVLVTLEPHASPVCAENSTSYLLRTEIDGELANSREFICEST